MKSKVLSLLTSAIALSLSVASAIPAFAQSTPAPTPTQHKQHKDFLNLTADQKAQMKQIRQTERTTIDNILTADQKAQLEAERQSYKANHTQANRNMSAPAERRAMHRDPFASLNLSAEQRSQIEAAHTTAKQQMDALLTPAQRQQIQQHMKQHQANQNR
ncbi:MAG TPA: hypothetical protein VL134_02010 [Leptolyngbya sp.]|jgi:Spy/CpxP family protein refolding chaperone|nr:hypothetical protein [Leptolyngbya sp.]